MLQRKLEEHEEALLGRAQVVDLLQQELTAAEQRNQVLPCDLCRLPWEYSFLRYFARQQLEHPIISLQKIDAIYSFFQHIPCA